MKEEDAEAPEDERRQEAEEGQRACGVTTAPKAWADAID